jgi:hypothetical protein
LYGTVEEEDKLVDEEDPQKMVSMAHSIMMHYAKQESITKRNKKRNISSRQARTA